LRELSLHILDLVENALRAGATVIAVSVEQDEQADRLLIRVEDDGPGLEQPMERALDPFFSTKPGKKTGLGLALFRFRLEQAGGRLTLARSPLGGLEVRGEMRLGHVDRSPLGDLASTVASVVCTNPGVELRARLRVGGREMSFSSTEIARGIPFGSRTEIAVARVMKTRIAEGLEALHAIE
jgi:signal transduction histidine kinase